IVRALNASATRETRLPKDAKASRGLTLDVSKPARKTSGNTGRGDAKPISVRQRRPTRRSKPTAAERRNTRKPGPIVEFPQARTDEWDDPAAFSEALVLHIHRHGETYWRLHRAVVRPGENLNPKTIRTWIEGTRTPRSVISLDVLRRIERRYQLPEGYFQTKFPHQSRAANGHELDGISRAERRRLAWHLPDNFNSLPAPERQRILEWVRRVIISGSTDYRRFQAAASKQRYAIKFPEIMEDDRKLEISD